MGPGQRKPSGIAGSSSGGVEHGRVCLAVAEDIKGGVGMGESGNGAGRGIGRAAELLSDPGTSGLERSGATEGTGTEGKRIGRKSGMGNSTGCGSLADNDTAAGSGEPVDDANRLPLAVGPKLHGASTYPAA